jgi:hypothetical protein
VSPEVAISEAAAAVLAEKAASDLLSPSQKAAALASAQRRWPKVRFAIEDREGISYLYDPDSQIHWRVKLIDAEFVEFVAVDPQTDQILPGGRVRVGLVAPSADDQVPVPASPLTALEDARDKLLAELRLLARWAAAPMILPATLVPATTDAIRALTDRVVRFQGLRQEYEAALGAGVMKLDQLRHDADAARAARPALPPALAPFIENPTDATERRLDAVEDQIKEARVRAREVADVWPTLADRIQTEATALRAHLAQVLETERATVRRRTEEQLAQVLQGQARSADVDWLLDLLIALQGKAEESKAHFQQIDAVLGTPR